MMSAISSPCCTSLMPARAVIVSSASGARAGLQCSAQCIGSVGMRQAGDADARVLDLVLTVDGNQHRRQGFGGSRIGQRLRRGRRACRRRSPARSTCSRASASSPHTSTSQSIGVAEHLRCSAETFWNADTTRTPSPSMLLRGEHRRAALGQLHAARPSAAPAAPSRRQDLARERVLDLGSGRELRRVRHGRGRRCRRALRGRVDCRRPRARSPPSCALISAAVSRARSRVARADHDVVAGMRPAQREAGAFLAGAAEHGDALQRCAVLLADADVSLIRRGSEPALCAAHHAWAPARAPHRRRCAGRWSGAS